MDTLGIITSISTFLSLGINYYLYTKIQAHDEFVKVANHNFGIIASIIKDNNERMIKNNQTLIDNTNKVIGVQQNQDSN